LKADNNGTTTTDGATVSTWEDQTVKSVDLSGQDDPKLYNNVLNFNPVVRYTGNDRHVLGVSDDITVKNSTVFNVAIPKSGYAELWTTDGGGNDGQGSLANVLIYKYGNVANNLVYYDQAGGNAVAVRRPGFTLTTGKPDLIRASFTNSDLYDGSYSVNASSVLSVSDINSISNDGGSINGTYKSLGN
jgi:hypothetical protein